MTTVAFLLWPLISLAFFRKLALPVAISVTVIGGYLMLPTEGGFKVTGLPSIDKTTMPALLALVFAAIFARNSPDVRPGWLPRSPIVLILIALLIAGKFGTFLTNPDPLVFGQTFLPALTLYDTIARVQTAIMLLVPFILARKYLASSEAHRRFLTVLVVAALGYSLLALYEVRMSPQLNNMIYGYFPHSWLQHIRRDGFRPIVFLQHGLWVGIFFACAVLAAAGLARIRDLPRRNLYAAAGVWLLFTLYMAKSLGAFSTTLLLLPILLFMAPRLQVLIVGIIGMSILTYPILRGAGFVPVDAISELAESISAERAESFIFRLNNEDLLLARANERPLFGWGAWGRSFIFDEEGRNISVTDGYWIIVIGVGGWVEYIGEFGLLCLAPLILALRRKTFDVSPATATLSVVLVVNLIDLIPNAGVTAVTWMMAGALAGRLELGRSTDTAAADASLTDAEPPAAGPSGRPTAPAYRRDFSDRSPGTSSAVAALKKDSTRGSAAKTSPSYARDFGQPDPTRKRRS
jgi:hypothetical protein